MRKIQSELEMQQVQFGEELDLGLPFSAYYSNIGTLNGKRWEPTIYWTVRRDGTSILEEKIFFGTCGPGIIGTIVHDSGLSGEYEKLNSWLKGVTANAI